MRLKGSSNTSMEGVVNVADQNENKIPVVEREPSKIEQVIQIAKITAVSAVGIAATLLGLAANETIHLGPAIHDVLTAIVGVGAALGIVSNGVAKKK